MMNTENKNEELAGQKEKQKGKGKIGKKKRLIIIMSGMCVLLFAGGTAFFFSKKNRNGEEWEGRKGMPFVMDNVGENVISASGLTSVGMLEEMWELDFLETSIYVEESYLSAGDEVGAGTAVFKVSEDTLEDARKELENAVVEAELAYRQGILDYEMGVIDARTENETAAVNKKYSQAEYDQAVAEAAKQVERLEEQVEEARELAEEYTKSVNEDYYRTYYQVDELYQSYYEHFFLLMDYYEKWGIEEKENTNGNSGSSLGGNLGSGTGNNIGNDSSQTGGTNNLRTTGKNSVSGENTVLNTNMTTTSGIQFLTLRIDTLAENEESEENSRASGDGSSGDDEEDKKEDGSEGNSDGNSGEDKGDKKEDGSGGNSDGSSGDDEEDKKEDGSEGNSDGNSGDDEGDKKEDGSGGSGDDDKKGEDGNGERPGGSGGGRPQMGQGGFGQGNMGEMGETVERDVMPEGGQGGGYDEEASLLSVYYLLDEMVQEEAKDYETALKNYNTAKRKASAGLEQALSNLEALEAELDQARTQYEKQLISCKEDYEITIAESNHAEAVYETTLESLEETLAALADDKEEAKENLALFEKTIGDGYFYTQNAGTIVMNAVKAKSYLSGKSLVIAYNNPETVTVTASVDQGYIADISIGDSVYVTVSEYGSYQGTVTVINPVAQAQSRSSVTYQVTVMLEGNVSALDSNLTAYVYFGMSDEMLQQMERMSGTGAGGDGMPAGENGERSGGRPDGRFGERGSEMPYGGFNERDDEIPYRESGEGSSGRPDGERGAEGEGQ